MTSKPFLWMRAGRAAKAASSFSLAIAAAIAFGSSYSEISRRLESSRSPSEVKRIISAATVDTHDAEMDRAISNLLHEDPPKSQSAQEVKDMVAVRAIAEGPRSNGRISDPSSVANGITSGPLYHDEGPKRESN